MKGILPSAVAFGLGLVCFLTYFVMVQAREPAYWPDSYEYAQVGRNLSEGRGLRTSALLERELAELGADELPAPYFLHDPGQALLVALFFRLFGASGATLAWVSGVSFALSCALAAALGGRLFGSHVRLPTAILVATATPMLEFSATGLSESTTACAFTGFLLMLVRAQGSTWGLFLAGLAYGVAVLVRSNALPFLPLLLAWTAVDLPPSSRALRERRLWPALGFRWAALLGGLVLVLAPSALRNFRELGSPLFSVAGGAGLVRGTELVHEDPLRSFTLLPETSAVLAHPDMLVRKSRAEIRRMVSSLFAGGLEPHATGAALILLFLAVGLSGAPAEEPAHRRHFRILLLGCIGVAILVGSLFELRWRHLYGFVPAAMALVAGFLVTEVGRAASGDLSYRIRLAGVLVVAALLGVLPLCGRPLTLDALDRDRAYRALGLFLRQSTPESAVVLVEATPLIPLSTLAWYGGRTYVAFSEGTLERMGPATAARPLYHLRILFRPSEAHSPITPGPPSFELVAAWQDRLGYSRAWLKRRPGPGLLSIESRSAPPPGRSHEDAEGDGPSRAREGRDRGLLDGQEPGLVRDPPAVAGPACVLKRAP